MVPDSSSLILSGLKMINVSGVGGGGFYDFKIPKFSLWQHSI